MTAASRGDCKAGAGWEGEEDFEGEPGFRGWGGRGSAPMGRSGHGGRGGHGLSFPPNGNGFASPELMGNAVMGGPALGPGQMLVLAPGVSWHPSVHNRLVFAACLSQDCSCYLPSRDG